MDRSTRHAALAAAAKVALSMSALACAGSTVTEGAAGGAASSSASKATAGATTTASNATAGVTTTASTASGAGGAGGSPAVCDAPPPDASVDSTVFDCCLAFVEPYVPEAGGSFDPSAASDPRIVDCCQAIVAHVDQDTQDFVKVPYQEMGACCTLLGRPVGTACTPWGPPVPPAMPAAWIEEVA